MALVVGCYFQYQDNFIELGKCKLDVLCLDIMLSVTEITCSTLSSALTGSIALKEMFPAFWRIPVTSTLLLRSLGACVLHLVIFFQM